jgi:hypothetical protein
MDGTERILLSSLGAFFQVGVAGLIAWGIVLVICHRQDRANKVAREAERIVRRAAR